MNILKKTIVYFTGSKQNKQTSVIQSIDTLPSRYTNVMRPAASRSFIQEKFHIIWLYSNIGGTSYDYKDAVNQLQEIVDNVTVFTNVSECFDFINNVKNKKIFMIVSDEFSQVILDPVIEKSYKIFLIYILSDNKDQRKDWPKVMGVYKDIKTICWIIKYNIKYVSSCTVDINYTTAINSISRENIDELDQSFMYTQILKKTLLSIDFTPKHMSEFIEYRRSQVADNTIELKNIEEFEKEYGHRTPIWWYINSKFILYDMINSALRTMEINLIILFGFLIKDFHQDIERLNRKQAKLDHFTVYRGQALFETELKQLQQAEGRLMAFNSFFSTSFSDDTARMYAESNTGQNNIIGVVYKISVDPSNASTYFANISEFSNYKDEEEILFSMHAIFRIGTIKRHENDDKLWQIELKLTNDEDQQLKDLTEFIEKEIKEPEGWLRLGRLMVKLAHFNKAEELCKKLLEEEPTEKKKANIFNLLGLIKHGQGKYHEAINYHRNSITLINNTQILNDPDMAESFINLGRALYEIGNYSEALSLYQLALEIYKENSSYNDFEWAIVYNDIRLVYDKMGKYDQASHYNCEIIEAMVETLPAYHPEMATVFCNFNYGEETNTSISCEEILSIYEKALKIQQKSLPQDHPSIAILYNMIVQVYTDMGNYYQAILFHKKALQIQIKRLPPNHPDWIVSCKTIGHMLFKKGNYTEACWFYKNALAIQKKILPLNHPDYIITCRTLALVYHRMKRYSKALQLYQYILDILKSSTSQNNSIIEELKEAMRPIEDTLSFIGKLPENHINLPAGNPFFALLRTAYSIYTLICLCIYFCLYYELFYFFWYILSSIPIYMYVIYFVLFWVYNIVKYIYLSRTIV